MKLSLRARYFRQCCAVVVVIVVFLFYCFSFSFFFQFMSDFSLKFCNILSNNPTGSSYFDCFSVCYIILISFLADLSSGHISSHLGFFGSS